MNPNPNLRPEFQDLSHLLNEQELRILSRNTISALDLLGLTNKKEEDVLREVTHPSITCMDSILLHAIFDFLGKLDSTGDNYILNRQCDEFRGWYLEIPGLPLVMFLEQYIQNDKIHHRFTIRYFGLLANVLTEYKSHPNLSLGCFQFLFDSDINADDEFNRLSVDLGEMTDFQQACIKRILDNALKNAKFLET